MAHDCETCGGTGYLPVWFDMGEGEQFREVPCPCSQEGVPVPERGPLGLLASAAVAALQQTKHPRWQQMGRAEFRQWRSDRRRRDRSARQHWLGRP